MPEEEVQTAEATGEGTTATAEATPFDWRSHVADDIREDPSLQMVHGESLEEVVGSLAKMQVNAQRAMGRDKVALPGQTATDEEIRTYYTAIGCPETHEGYKPPTENISDKFSTELFDAGREEAHRLGLTGAQYAGLSRFLDTQQTAAREATAEANEAQMAADEKQLQKEHGEAFGQNMALAKHIIHTFGSEGLEKLIEDHGLDINPDLFNFLANIGRAMGEDEILGGGGAQVFDNTPEQATEAWNALKGDKEFLEALQSNRHPGHENAVSQQRKLFQQGAKA